MKRYRIWMITAAAILCMNGLTACGTDSSTPNTADNSTLQNQGGVTGETNNNGAAPGQENTTDSGIGNDTSNDRTGQAEPDQTGGNDTTGDDTAGQNGGVVGDVADDVGDAGKAVIDGAENVVDDLVGNTESNDTSRNP